MDQPQTKLKPGPKVDEAKHREIIEMYDAGVRNIGEFTANVALSEQSVRKVLKANNRTLPRASRPQEQIEGICADYTKGMPIRELLHKWDISANTMYEVLYEEEVPIRRLASSSKHRVDAAVELYQAGEKIDTIREETQLGAQTLYNELEKRQIDVHRSKNDEVLNEAIELYQKGISTLEITAQTGVSTTRLYPALRAREIPLRGHQLTNVARLDKAIKMYQDGNAVEVIYEKTKVSPALLYRTLYKRGIAKRGKAGSPATEDMDAAVAMYQNNETLGNIFEATGIKSKTLYLELRSRGIELRP